MRDVSSAIIRSAGETKKHSCHIHNLELYTITEREKKMETKRRRYALALRAFHTIAALITVSARILMVERMKVEKEEKKNHGGGRLKPGARPSHSSLERRFFISFSQTGVGGMS